LRRGDVALRPRRIGRGEHLFRRDVRQMAQPVPPAEVAAAPPARGQETDRQRRPRPLELERVEASLGQRGGGALELLAPLVPCGTGVRLVEPQDVPELVPEPLVRLAFAEAWEDEPRPRGV